VSPAKHHSNALAGAFALSVIWASSLHAETAPADTSGLPVVAPPTGGAKAGYDIAPTPEWVREPSVEDADGGGDMQVSGGIANLLVDRQIRVRNGWTEYDRFVTRVVNPAGIDDASQITIDFDPQLDRVHVHSVTLRRGGEIIDALSAGRIEVLQRESRLEQATLDGTLTFHLLMSDVRVGDIVDCRYTIEHHNPAWGDRFFGRLLVRWDDPVQRSMLRVTAPVGEPLYFRAGASGEPVRRIEGDWQALEWDWSQLPAVTPEADAPSWYEQYPAIQFSQFAGWADVVSTELPLFARRHDDEAPEMKVLIERLRSQARSNAERAQTALQFVQEEVRYTGIELGTGAYAPRSPAEVLRRRYGDCKEKALLAVTLLHALGIEADLALVSSHWMGHLHERLPSPSAFDHAIVRIRLGGRTYWVDPTVTAQGGTLATLAQADFGEALVIGPRVTALDTTASASPMQPLIAATTTVDLRAGIEGEAGLSVSTRYRGSAAEDLRRRLRRTSASQLGAQYLNYYRTRYRDIRAEGAPEFHDDLAANEILVKESYRVAHLGGSGRNGESRVALEADLVGDSLAAPIRGGRTTPLALRQTTDVAEQITAWLPDSARVEQEGVTLDTPSFHYESHVSRQGNEAVLSCRYRTLTDEVPVGQMAEFLQQRAIARRSALMSLVSEEGQPDLTVAEASHPPH
jgi:hypothetical protein